MNFMGLLTFVVGVAMLAAPVRWSFTVMILSTVFGAAAAFSVPGLGGASVLVPSLFLLFFGVRLFLAYGEGPLFAALAPPRPGFCLLVLTLFGLATAVFFPRLFQGMTETMTVERAVGGRNFISLVPLKFSSNNITQSVYAIGGLVCFAATFAFIRKGGTPTNLINGMLVVASVNLGFALADIITYFSHTEFLLGFVRTANYALLTNAEKGGLKRISGTFPEASAFADFTLVLFAMTASLWLSGIRSRATGIIAGLLLVALILSTSATALVGLGLVLPVLCLQSFLASRNEPGTGRPVMIVAIMAAMPLVILFVLIAMPDLANGLHDFLDEMLFSKADSQSGRERFMWNSMAYQTFIDTQGFGAGLGSARASSFGLVLLSNLGIPGALIFALFVLLILKADTRARNLPSREAAAVARAAKAGFITVLVSAATSGTVYDLGLMFYILAGSVSALTVPSLVRAHDAPAARMRQIGVVGRLP
ncbi:O-antigen ligase family protein (plasmid) [Rhizobium sp. CB3060]|uniref:O-antigen ligase family protein n=1 Tax=Rhizobium sp. CB3060 TaxID=3138255 RepID=UPI0021A3130B|nr:O-antigen ligase family protein [Rhizobium tropici]UWU24998.1 O-antigen ligase family protein [Rhizobium tropici]